MADLAAHITAGRITFDITNDGEYLLTTRPDGLTYVLQPVPEPSCVLGVVALAWAGRRVARRSWRA